MRTASKPQIAFDDVGDREPGLLCLPGWCAPRDAFRPMYEHLTRRTLAVDWRGHGGSDPASGDFGTAQLVDDACAVIEASGAARVVPVATAHAGFVAIELRKRLGAQRVPGVVLVDWMVLGGPPPFLNALEALQQPATTLAVRDRLFAMWTTGVEHPGVQALISKMAASEPAMWQRAGREIAASFTSCRVPLDALGALHCPTLHVYAQPADPEFYTAQQQFAERHAWFRVERLDAASHFPSVEVPFELASAIERFVSGIVA